ncbi:MAG: hypothetical protein OXC03_08580 [Flavobacteriaceae bacterium]|nr:hypothetical protein [Flavobacteriaceae bacterium]
MNADVLEVIEKEYGKDNHIIKSFYNFICDEIEIDDLKWTIVDEDGNDVEIDGLKSGKYPILERLMPELSWNEFVKKFIGFFILLGDVSFKIRRADYPRIEIEKPSNPQSLLDTHKELIKQLDKDLKDYEEFQKKERRNIELRGFLCSGENQKLYQYVDEKENIFRGKVVKVASFLCIPKDRIRKVGSVSYTSLDHKREAWFKWGYISINKLVEKFNSSFKNCSLKYNWENNKPSYL